MKRLFELFWVFFKIGAFTFGGGYAMIPLIKAELVDCKKWITDDEFFDVLAIAQSSPGPLAVNVSVFLGLKTCGFWGLIFATVGATLPSFIVILAIAMVLGNIQDNPYVVAAFKGIKPAVVALILVPVWTLAQKAKITKAKLILPIGVSIAVAFLNVSPIFFVIAGMVGGNLVYRRPRL